MEGQKEGRKEGRKEKKDGRRKEGTEEFIVKEEDLLESVLGLPIKRVKGRRKSEKKRI